MAAYTNKYTFLNQFNIKITTKMKSFNWLQLDPSFRFLDYDHASITSRLNQVFLNSKISTIRMLASRLIANGESLESVFSSSFKDSDIDIDWTGTRLKLSVRYSIYLYIKFLYYWTYQFLTFFKGVLFRNEIQNISPLGIWNTTVSISNNLPGNLEPFLDFCKLGPLSGLKGNLVVLCDKNQTQKNTHYFRQKPYLFCLNHPSFKVIAGIKTFLKFHFKYLFIVSWSFLKKSPLLWLGKDLSQSSLIRTLQKFEIISDIYITNSDMTDQPLWMRDNKLSIKTHFVWYSTNAQNFTFFSDQYTPEQDNPQFSFLQINDHWMWNTYQVNWGRGHFKDSQLHSVGPLLLYPRPKHIVKTKNEEFIISVFDVSPLNEVTAYKYFGSGINYYSEDVLMKFIKDIIEQVSQVFLEKKLSYKIQIKHKRTYSSQTRSQDYKAYVGDLINRNELIALPVTTSLYEIIQRSDLIICIPYTSPAHIAREFEIPCCFYDPSDQLVDNQTGVPLLKGAGELKKFIDQTVVL